MQNYPVRSFANKSVIDPGLTKKESIANEDNTEKLVNAIKGESYRNRIFKSSGKLLTLKMMIQMDLANTTSIQ